MGFEREFRDLMRQQVTLRPYTGMNAYGEPTHGDPITYWARVEGRHRRVQAANGEERVSSVTVILLGSTGVTVHDRITLPEGFSPAEPQILAVSRAPDERGDITEILYT